MKNLTASSFAFLFILVIASANCAEMEQQHQADLRETTLVGQVLLPGGFSRRGLEVHATITTPNGESLDKWLIFNEEGRFSHAFKGRLEDITVTAGVSFEVFRIERGVLPDRNQAARVDVGIIDLRDRLKRHHLMIRSVNGNASGAVRVAMWFSPPPVGPDGGRVSLGSKQFPPITIDHEQEWLVPLKAQSIYFLVERPAVSGQKSEWRSGHQKLFGPFTSAALPTQLLID